MDLDVKNPFVLEFRSVPALVVDANSFRGVENLIKKKSIFRDKNRPIGVIVSLDKLLEEKIIDFIRLKESLGIEDDNLVIVILHILEDLAFVRIPIIASKWRFSERLIDKENSILQYISFSRPSEKLSEVLALIEGLPMLAATSFNPHGEPIPSDKKTFDHYLDIMKVTQVIRTNNYNDIRKGSFPILEFVNKETNVAREGNLPTYVIRSLLKDISIVHGYEGEILEEWQPVMKKMASIEVSKGREVETLLTRKNILVEHIHN